MIGGIAQVKIVLRSRGKFPDSSGWKPVLRKALRMPENFGHIQRRNEERAMDLRIE